MNSDTCSNCGTTVATSPTVLGPKDNDTGLTLGGWGRRFGATFVDNILIYILLEVLIAIKVPTGWRLVAFLGAQAVLLVGVLYYTGGRTVGNMVARTRVCDSQSGEVPTLRQAVAHWFPLAMAYTLIILYVPGLVVFGYVFLVVDGLYPLRHLRNQTLHDLFARTLVVLTIESA